MRIEDKCFVVTGAGNGIGRQVAIRLVEGGARVVGVDLNEQGLIETARLASGGSFTPYVTDITDRAAVEKLRASIAEDVGAVDGLVNIAGVIQKFVKVIDLPFSEIEKVMNVNFWGTMTMVKAFLPELLERPEASIVNVASMGSYAPVPGQAVYGASKAAVKLLSEALYAELLGTNVEVSVIFPGAIGTQIAANSGVSLAAASGNSVKYTSPEAAAGKIVRAIRSGRFHTAVGTDAKALKLLSRLNLKATIKLVARQMGDLLG